MSGALTSALGDLEKAVAETEQRLAGVATKVDSVLNSAPPQQSEAPASSGKGVSATTVLEEFHAVKTDFKSIVEQVEAFKKEQNQFLQDIQAELLLAQTATDSLKQVSNSHSAQQ